jgi:hypothetical protein
LEGTEGLDEKSGQEGSEECGLDCGSSQMCRVSLEMLRGRGRHREDLTLVVLNASDFEVVLTSRFWLVYWIWK